MTNRVVTGQLYIYKLYTLRKTEVLFAASENTSSNRHYVVRSAHLPLPYCFTDKSAIASGTMMRSAVASLLFKTL